MAADSLTVMGLVDDKPVEGTALLAVVVAWKEAAHSIQSAVWLFPGSDMTAAVVADVVVSKLRHGASAVGPCA